MKPVDSWRAARELRDVMFLDRMGWGVALGVWRTISLLAAAVAAVTAALAGCAGVVVLAGVLRGDFSAVVAAVLVSVVVYVGLGFTLRCLVGTESELLARHPYRAFYCALDLPKVVVVAQRVIPRLGLIFVLEEALASGAFIGLRMVGHPPGLVISMAVLSSPLASAGIGAAIAALMSLHEPADRGLRIDVVLLGVVASLTCSVGASVGWAAHFVRSQNVTDPVGEVGVSALIWAGLAAAIALGVASIALTAHATGRLVERSWSIVKATGVSREQKGPDAATRRRAGLVGFLVETSTLRAYRRVFFATTALGASSAGMLVVGASALDFRVGEVVGRVGLTVTFVAALTVSDVLLARIGPHSLESILRYAYEQGRSAAVLAVRLQTFHLAATLIVIAPVMAACGFGGAAPLSCGLVAAIASSAGLLASAITTASRSNDSGQASGSPAAILVAVMISASAVAVAVFIPTAVSLPGLGVAALVLLGSTHTCLHHRIVRRPLNVAIS